MCNVGNYLQQEGEKVPGNKFATTTRAGGVLTGGVANAIARNKWEIPHGDETSSIDELAAVNAGKSKTYRNVARGVGAAFGLGAAAGASESDAGATASESGAVDSTGASGATGTPVGGSPTVGGPVTGTDAVTGGTVAGAVAPAGMSVTDIIKLGSVVAATAINTANYLQVRKQPKPSNTTPGAPPQPGRSPEYGAVQQRNRDLFGGNSTILTGPGGVPNSSLNLGRNILLGS